MGVYEIVCGSGMVENEVYLGNAYELIKQVQDKSVDLIITDPPYELNVEGGGGLIKTRGHSPSFHRELKEEGLDRGLDFSILDEFVRVMKKINLYIWCNKPMILPLLKYFVDGKNCNYEILVWAKENPVPFCGTHYLTDKEFCLYFWETGAKLKTSFETGRTVYFTKVNTEDKKKYNHPTIKPLEIIENLVKNSSGGGLILDPFCGSGTTLVAAKRNGLPYIGFEINPKFYKIAKDRLDGFDQRGRMNLLDI